MERYTSSHYESKAKRRLRSFAQKVTFYGGVMDVFVQHHPEYVALAWGAMKLLFTGVMNHENSIGKLAKGLSRIADRLPRAEILATLYPTPKMQEAMAQLNAYILRFLVRAHDWCKERPWEHILHSFTRPPELRYDDLLESIATSTDNIKELALCGEQVKIHAVQHKVDLISAKVDSLGDVSTKLEKIQQTQASIATAVSRILAPDKVLHYLQFQALRPRATRASGPTLSRRFLNSPRLRSWDGCGTSAIMIARANFRCRQAIRFFCWDLVQQLHASKISTLFAMKTPHLDTDSSMVTSTDVLKYLIQQGLQITQNLQTESSMSLTCTRFHSSLDEDGLFQLLEAVLADIPGSTYLLVDLELPSRDMTVPNGFSWLHAFLGFFDRLEKRKPEHQVKILLFSYSSDLPFTLSAQETAEFVLRAKSVGRTAQQRRARRISGITKQRGGFKIRGIRNIN
ncbi:uncharacterized protein PG998_010724 [Apiospora kogelbergensis]|uniref:uncharacterized protein n=1 Tax=Apiospora kogelbergensis TaxID=1337665 RepID=UPI00312E5D49